ncbi:MAG: hypothetical protein AAFQ96_10160, partial [Pseudomonadota bacterium]
SPDPEVNPEARDTGRAWRGFCALDPDLRAELVAAFRATLEEVLEADIILHVRDASHADSDAQRDDVIAVLEALGIKADNSAPVVEVMNKLDLLDTDDRDAMIAGARAAMARLEQGDVSFTIDDPLKAPISAINGYGVEGLCAIIDHLITADRATLEVRLPAEMDGDAGAARAWLHERGDIENEINEGMTTLRVRLSPQVLGQFKKRFPLALVSEDAALATASLETRSA